MNPRLIGKGHRPFAWKILFTNFFVLLNLRFVTCFYYHTSDECSWSGSGSTEADSLNSGIKPIYLRCREGIVQWEYPNGALRVVLHLGHSNKEFQGCLKVSPGSSGASLYLEEHQKLHLLYRYNSAQTLNQEQCFQSQGGCVAFFIEAEGSTNMTKRNTFAVMYDLQSMHQKSFSECRPCTDKELIYYFCTSDFVARGTISSIFQNEQNQRTELTITGHKIFRDSKPKVFGPFTEAFTNRTVQRGVMYRPLHCGTKAGRGEFLLLGQWRLGEPILTCVPRWTEWKKVRRRSAFLDNADCMLE